jgi:hypothetical protein
MCEIAWIQVVRHRLHESHRHVLTLGLYRPFAQCGWRDISRVRRRDAVRR